MKTKNTKSIFQLEKNVVVNYTIIQQNLYYFIKQSKFTFKELAEEINIDQTTMTTRFKELTWKPKELYQLFNLIDSKFHTNLQEIESSVQTKDKEKK